MTLLFLETNVADKTGLSNEEVYELMKGKDEMKNQDFYCYTIQAL